MSIRDPLGNTQPGKTLGKAISHIITYPLGAFNARVVLEKESPEKRSSATVVFRSLFDSYQKDGLPGVYRALPEHAFHGALLHGFKIAADRILRMIEEKFPNLLKNKSDEAVTKRRYVAKYLCEIMCYPALTLATRSLLVNTSWTEIKRWHKVDGIHLWYHGLWPFLIQLAMDDIGSHIVHNAISGFDPEDKAIMEMSSTALLLVLIVPISNISIVRRCHSNLNYLLEPKTLREQFDCNPWGAILFQFTLFSAVLLANYYLIKMKFEDDEHED